MGRADGGHRDASVYLEGRGRAAFIQQAAHPGNLVGGARKVALAPETGIDRHNQHQAHVIHHFLEVGHRGDSLGARIDLAFARLSGAYQRWLGPALHHRAAVMGAAFVFFLVSTFGILPLLRKEFVPSQDTSLFQLRFQTPVGTSLDATDRVFAQIERLLAARPEVTRYFGVIGGFGGGEVNTGFMFVTLKDPHDRPVDPNVGHRLTQQELMGVVRSGINAIPGARGTLQDPSQQGFSATRGAK